MGLVHLRINTKPSPLLAYTFLYNTFNSSQRLLAFSLHTWGGGGGGLSRLFCRRCWSVYKRAHSALSHLTDAYFNQY